LTPRSRRGMLERSDEGAVVLMVQPDPLVRRCRIARTGQPRLCGGIALAGRDGTDQ